MECFVCGQMVLPDLVAVDYVSSKGCGCGNKALWRVRISKGVEGWVGTKGFTGV